MMKKPQTNNPALHLANLVLTERIPLDEGIVRAQTSGILVDLIQGLNVITGGNFFDIDEMKQRVRSGDALRALQGRLPLLELPANLNVSVAAEGSPDPSGEQPAVPSVGGDSTENTEQQEEETRARLTQEVSEIARKIRALREERREHAHQIAFIEAVEKQKSIRPKPWVAGMVIAVFTMILAGPVFLLVASPVVLLVFVSVGLGLAAVVVQRESVWYRHDVQIETTAAEQRHRIKEIHRKQIARVDDEVMGLRNSVRPLLEVLPDSQRSVLEATYPEAFGKA